MHLSLDPTSFVLGILAGVAIIDGLLVAAVLVIHWIAKQGHSTDQAGSPGAVMRAPLPVAADPAIKLAATPSAIRGFDTLAGKLA